MQLIFKIVLFVSLPIALLKAEPRCTEVLNGDLGRLGIGSYKEPRGTKTVAQGMVAGVSHNYNRLLAFEAKQKQEKREANLMAKRGRYIASATESDIAVKNIKNEFEWQDLVYLGLGYKYREAQTINWKGRNVRMYWSGDDLKGYVTDLSGDPLIVKVTPQCTVRNFHILGAKSDRTPYLSFNSNSCAVLNRIEVAAPLLTTRVRGQSEEALCESVGGGLDVRGACRCKRQRSKTILPPHEVCNESELRRQARKAVHILRSVGNKLPEETELDRMLFEKIERACRVYSKYLDKSDFGNRRPASWVESRESRRR